jgi:hypothetical protein
MHQHLLSIWLGRFIEMCSILSSDGGVGSCIFDDLLTFLDAFLSFSTDHSSGDVDDGIIDNLVSRFKSICSFLLNTILNGFLVFLVSFACCSSNSTCYIDCSLDSTFDSFILDSIDIEALSFLLLCLRKHLLERQIEIVFFFACTFSRDFGFCFGLKFYCIAT